MFATSSSFNWFIGGITELYSCPLTVTLPERPCSTTPTARCTSADRKSDLASGGNTPGMPLPSDWWHTEQVPAKSDWPALICSSPVRVPAAADLLASVTDA